MLKIKAKAEMIKKDKLKNSRTADWTVNAEFEQSIVWEISKSIQTALEAVHKVAQEKIDGVKAIVAEAEKRYKAAIEDVQKFLDDKRAALDKANNEIDRRLIELKQSTAKGKAECQAHVNNAKMNETKNVQNAKNEKERELEEKCGDVRSQETKLRDVERSSQDQNNEAVSK